MNTCAQCTQFFEITDADRAFFVRLDVPEPVLCPPCRWQLHLAFRNEKTLYMRVCELCKKNTLSMYAPDASYHVYCVRCWNSDGWEALEYGRDVRPTEPFFEHMNALMHVVPRMALFHVGENENSQYANFLHKAFSAYLAFSSVETENIFYSRTVDRSRDCVDCLNCLDAELLYECINCENCYQSQYLERCVKVRESALCVDCHDCAYCFGCANLRHKQYYWFDKQLSKEEWQKKWLTWQQGDAMAREQLIQEARVHHSRAIKKFASVVRCEDSTGEYLTNCKNCVNCFDGHESENCKDSIRLLGAKDAHSFSYGGLDSELLYNSLASNYSHNIRFSMYSSSNRDCEYVDNCKQCADCFGCTGLSHKQYCILNKQYSKEEFHRVRAELVAAMRERGEYGQFFPAALSPFGYNETLAHEYYPLTKEAALRTGFHWKDQLPGTYGSQTKSWDDVSPNIKDTDESITKEVFACTECTKNYKIIKQELLFYKRFSIPLPRRCFECRLKARMFRRNPFQLWKRQCVCVEASHSNHAAGTQCSQIFETAYSPDRQEKLYCEQCFHAVVI